jgi:SAM-dependent methyltransferase
MTQKVSEQRLTTQVWKKRTTGQVKSIILQRTHGTFFPWEKEYLDYHASRFKETINRLGPGEGKRLLDVGAFPGHLTLALQDAGYRVEALTGTDESDRGLEIFGHRMAVHQIPVAMADVEFDRFPFANETFDVVLAAEIIEHLPFNPYHLLREAFRVLKPGGRLLLTTPNLPKLDNWIQFFRGRSIHPDVRLPFHKTFKSILTGRHIREYTASELIYMLEEQNKEMYRFERSQVDYSMCLDPAFSWKGTVSWFIKKLWPRTRATIFIKSYRSKNLDWISSEDLGISGFYEVEEHDSQMGSTGRILATPFRWSCGQAELDLPAGIAAFQVFFLHLIFLAPRYLPPVILNLRMGENDLGRVALKPGREYVPIRLALPVQTAVKGRFKLSWTCNTWRPSDHAAGVDYYEFPATDERELGVALAWDGILRKDCSNIEELKEVAAREKKRSILREGYEAQWSPLSGLYLIQARMRSKLEIGPGDWQQLGMGWHNLEKWPQGWMRWSSKTADFYLAPGSGFRRLCIRGYTGEKALGSVSGIVEVQWSEDRLIFKPFLKEPFTLPADKWNDLKLDLPQPFPSTGLLRVLITVDQPRVPIRLILDSQDRRELGLAIERIFLE